MVRSQGPRLPPPPSFSRPRNNSPGHASPYIHPVDRVSRNPSQNQLQSFLNRNGPLGFHNRTSSPIDMVSRNGYGNSPLSPRTTPSPPWFHYEQPGPFNPSPLPPWEQARPNPHYRPTPALPNSFSYIEPRGMTPVRPPPGDFYSAEKSPINQLSSPLPFPTPPGPCGARAGPSRPIPQQQFQIPAAAITRPGNPGYFTSEFLRDHENPNVPRHNPFNFENEAPGSPVSVPPLSYPELVGFLNNCQQLQDVLGLPGPPAIPPNFQIPTPAQDSGLYPQAQVLRAFNANPTVVPIPMVGVWRGGGSGRVQKPKKQGNGVARQLKKFGRDVLAPCFGFRARNNSDSGSGPIYSSPDESTPVYRNPICVPESEEYAANYPLPPKLYHYTNKAGAQGILEDGYLRVSAEGMSSPNLETLSPNARHGIGIYFSVIPPEAPAADILRNNYGATTNNRFGDRADFCFEFNSEYIPGLKGPMLYDSMTGQDLFSRGRLIWITKVHKFFLNKVKPEEGMNVGIYYERLPEPGDREESNKKKPRQVIPLEWQFDYDSRED